MSDLVLDPEKMYAEMSPGTNLVGRIFPGQTIPSWAMYPGRKIVEIPQGVVVNIGDRYQDGVFAPLPPPPTLDERAAAELDSPIWRLIFEVNFDQETRLRVLEGKQAINRLQYRAALIN